MTRRPVRLAAALLFWPLLAAWTWLLVRPNPIPEVVDAIPTDLRLLAAKSLHGCTYALLTVLGLAWPATRPGRVAVVALLVAHGAGTEAAQALVPHRSGRVLDVAIDWAGVLAGMMIVRFSIRDRRTPGPVLPTDRAG
jgi:VanZ family protein